MIFPIKKRVNTGLFMGWTAAIYIGLSRIIDRTIKGLHISMLRRLSEPWFVQITFNRILNYTICWIFDSSNLWFVKFAIHRINFLPNRLLSQFMIPYITNKNRTFLESKSERSQNPMMCEVRNSARAARPHDVCSGLQGTSCFQGVRFLVENWALLLDIGWVIFLLKTYYLLNNIFTEQIRLG